MPLRHREPKLPRETMTGRQLTAGSGVAHETLFGMRPKLFAEYGVGAVENAELYLEHLCKTARTLGRVELHKQRKDLYTKVTKLLESLAAPKKRVFPPNHLADFFHDHPEQQEEILERLRAIQKATAPKHK